MSLKPILNDSSALENKSLNLFCNSLVSNDVNGSASALLSITGDPLTPPVYDSLDLSNYAGLSLFNNGVNVMATLNSILAKEDKSVLKIYVYGVAQLTLKHNTTAGSGAVLLCPSGLDQVLTANSPATQVSQAVLIFSSADNAWYVRIG